LLGTDFQFTISSPFYLCIDKDFEKNLAATFERFNEFARKGVDEDFHRERKPHGKQFSYTDNSMYPLSP